jgi:transformation/transcription domain-associated protein
MLADFIHHVRADLSSSQLAMVVKTYCAMMHNAATSGGFQTMCAKLLSTVTESVISKHSRESAAEALYGLLECNVEKLMSVSLVHDELRKYKEQTESDAFIYIRLEKSKPIYGAAFVSENKEDIFKGDLASKSRSFQSKSKNLQNLVNYSEPCFTEHGLLSEICGRLRLFPQMPRFLGGFSRALSAA